MIKPELMQLWWIVLVENIIRKTTFNLLGLDNIHIIHIYSQK